MTKRTLLSFHRWLHANLLLPVVAALTLGTALARDHHASATGSWWFYALAICAGATLLLFHYRKTTAVYPIIATFFIIGIMHAGFHLTMPRGPLHIHNKIGLKERVTLSGILAGMPEYNGEKTKFNIKTDGVLFHNGPGETKRRLQQVTGLVRLSLSGKMDATLMPGDQLLVLAVISRISDYRTPGVFSYRTHMAMSGIHVSGWVDSTADIVRLRAGPTSLLHKTRYLAERARARIADFLDNNLEPTTSGLYQALLIGNRSRLSAPVLERYRDIGCMHLLAISGLHMSLLGVMTTLVITWLLKRSVKLMLLTHVPTVAAALSLIPLIGYAYIAGLNTPVLRALIMAMLVITALCLRLRHSLTHLVAAAAFFIIAFNPLSLYGASFQLSMSAVLAIALIAPRLITLLESRTEAQPGATRGLISFFTTTYKYIQAAFLVSVAATLGTLPFTLWHFNRFSLIGPLSNLFIEPLLCLWALPLGLLAMVLMPIYPPGALLFLHLGGLGITAAEYTASALQRLPFSSIWAITPSWLEITGYYAALSLWYWRGKIKHGKLIAATAMLLLLSAYTRDLWLPVPSSTLAKVSFIDVGQGAATLIQSPRRTSVLLDTGGPASRRFNVGESIVGPFLGKNRIWRLNDVVISHAHADHFNGMDFIIHRFHPKRLWISRQLKGHNDISYQKLLADAERLGIEVLVPEPGQYLLREPDTQLVNLKDNDYESAEDGGNQQLNDNSLVLRFDHGDNSFLFPGDISTQVESHLVSKRINLQADVLLAPHHGSKSSSGHNFINTVDPSHIVVSAGRYGKGRYPVANHLRYWEQQDINTLITREVGTIFCLSDGEHLVIETSCAP